MPQPGTVVSLLAAVSLSTLTVAACSGGSEQPVLNQFFSASRLRDKTALQSFARVAFEPRLQGTINRFVITSVTPEQRKPLKGRALAQEHDAAQAEGARSELASESSIVELSVEDQRNTIDITKYDGNLVSKKITIAAPVKLPHGGTAQKTLIVTMQRAVLKGDKEITGRWIITRIKDTTPLAATKTS